MLVGWGRLVIEVVQAVRGMSKRINHILNILDKR